MTLAVRRRTATRVVALDRSLEALPLFRLSDSAEDAAVTFVDDNGGRWRVIPAPGDRLPGTFDQDVYVELCRRFHEGDQPRDGVVTFTLHNFLRSIGRRNAALRKASAALAKRLVSSKERAAVWIGKDALRDLGRRNT